MGTHPQAIHEILVPSYSDQANHTKDVFIFVPNGTGEKICCKVSVEVCGEVAAEDLQCDISIELEEVVTKAMVGHFGFTKKFRSSEHEGNIQWA